MTLDFELGKIIVNAHELMIRIDGEQRLTLHAQTDAIQLLGQVLVVTDAQSRFSLKLPEAVIAEISQTTGIPVT
ncbi:MULTISPECIES: DUF3389 family protein [Vibrio]|uniref:DUF3389 domain-containing protein n=1 Tax=Vibrio halioticoli NBRC 102217 TaxID=1219072 RepID=V5HPD6_9VIBR|nr:MULTISPECIES: DUF3389 family protein [Vibrio]MPW37885.1 DUF3389 family protein [Vibrio sp. B1Z05]GAD91105.1 hypothetical protein VHA01S_068_00130 [Vibrio halioticoli NBRC 102217]